MEQLEVNTPKAVHQAAGPIPYIAAYCWRRFTLWIGQLVHFFAWWHESTRNRVENCTGLCLHVDETSGTISVLRCGIKILVGRWSKTDMEATMCGRDMCVGMVVSALRIGILSPLCSAQSHCSTISSNAARAIFVHSHSAS
mmetsp:Transcript_6465/g.20183  ORF Transcript_6465/g.20183 Transcript_6465/m.20183 type:complete len:141 (-) Transcript_6465:26-448(-)|eukprot:scaffold181256_cov38-Tisochrysis_lutea.AAC.1